MEVLRVFVIFEVKLRLWKRKTDTFWTLLMMEFRKRSVVLELKKKIGNLKRKKFFKQNLMEKQNKDILEIIDDGIQEAYRRFRIEEFEKNNNVKRDPMLEKIHKGILKAYQHIPAELEYERKQKEKLKESQS
jgi:hypothetical protein